MRALANNSEHNPIKQSKERRTKLGKEYPPDGHPDLTFEQILSVRLKAASSLVLRKAICLRCTELSQDVLTRESMGSRNQRQEIVCSGRNSDRERRARAAIELYTRAFFLE